MFRCVRFSSVGTGGEVGSASPQPTHSNKCIKVFRLI